MTVQSDLVATRSNIYTCMYLCRESAPGLLSNHSNGSLLGNASYVTTKCLAPVHVDNPKHGKHCVQVKIHTVNTRFMLNIL